MNKTRVAINGFGRIGRLTLRRLLLIPEIEVVAINDLTSPDLLAHLMQFDSVHGSFDQQVDSTKEAISIGSRSIKVYSEKDPANLPWASLKVDIVLEATGKFVTQEGCQKHLDAGAKRVVISAPGKGDIKMVVLGVNEHVLSSVDTIVSNASCTTNCLAPMAKVLDDHFGIQKGYISTVHAYTGDQNLQDAPHRDWRRARAAALSIVPTSTGAASAVGKVLPKLKGKLDGIALRVPIPDGSLTDFTVVLDKETNVDQVNEAMRAASEGAMKGVLQYLDKPLVSVDIVGNVHSCIFDSALTSVNGNLVKVVGWYDNEYGYACRTADLINKLSKLETDAQ